MNRRVCWPGNWLKQPMKFTICDLRFAIRKIVRLKNQKSKIKNWKKFSIPTTAQQQWKSPSSLPMNLRGAHAESRWGERPREPCNQNFFRSQALITATPLAQFHSVTLIYFI